MKCYHQLKMARKETYSADYRSEFVYGSQDIFCKKYSMLRLEIPRRGRVYLKIVQLLHLQKKVMVDNTYIQDATLHENILLFNTKTFLDGILLLFSFNNRSLISTKVYFLCFL